MKEIIKIEIPESANLSKSKAEQIKATFEPMALMLSQFEDAYNEVVERAKAGVTTDVITQAKHVRRTIAGIRIEAEKVRVAEKEEYIRAGRAIDGANNILKWAIIDKENALKHIEETPEREAAERAAALHEKRVDAISPYLENASEREFGSMEQDVFDALFKIKKQEYEDAILAEKKAEEERIAREKKAEQERIAREKAQALHEKRKALLLDYWAFVPLEHRSRDFSTYTQKEFDERLEWSKNEKLKHDKAIAQQKEENERLKKEREASEAKAKKESERLKKEKEAQEAKAKKELEAVRAKAQKELDDLKAKSRKEQQEALDAKMEALKESQRKDAELKALREAEVKAKVEEDARIQDELNKGDSAKISDLLSDLNDLRTKYTFKSEKNKALYVNVGLLINKVIKYINE